MNTTDAKRVLETALICAPQPLSVRELGTLFDAEVSADTLKTLLADLQLEWTGRGVELVQVASGWRFQSRPELRPYLDRLHPEKPPRYSRATMETLAIIAYRQPVTRGDMEDIRGVTINSLIIKQLEDRGWVEVIGHRETVGRPALFATTRQFLDDLGLSSLDQLPPLEGSEVQESALERLDFESLSVSLPPDTSDAPDTPEPDDSPALTDVQADSATSLSDPQRLETSTQEHHEPGEHPHRRLSRPPDVTLEPSSPAVAPEVPATPLAPPRDTDPQAMAFDDVVSGAFDAAQEQDLPLPTKRVLAPQAESPKLHKVLAQAGMGSRLEMEQLILEGRISVNGEPAHIGQRIQFGDVIKVNGKPVRVRMTPPPPRVLAYHKPAGEVVSHDDPQNRPTVFRRLPKLMQGKWQSVGRLDLNTEGLLLLTSSGELANRLMHPRFGLQREYAVRVLGALSNDEKQRLLDGVRLDDGMAQFASIEDGGGEGANCWYRVTIGEGRNREVRRMLEAVGHAVSRLIRIRYGAMMLPRGLKRGAWLELDDRDIGRLTAAAGLADTAEEGPRGPRPGGRHPAQRGKQGGKGGRSQGNPPGSRGEGPGFGDRRASSGYGMGGAPAGPKPRGAKGGGGAGGGKGQGGAGSQPDPMKTSFGYIGQDALQRRREQEAGRGGPPGGSRRRGGGGGRSGGR